MPLLLGFATMLFALRRPHHAVAARRARCARHGREPQIKVTSLPMLLPVSVYGGYFGAGVGVLLVAVMQLATGGEYRPANARRIWSSASTGSPPSTVFIAQGRGQLAADAGDDGGACSAR